VLAAKLNNVGMPNAYNNSGVVPFSGRYIFNLLGDPALNIMAEGFQITHKTVLDNITDLSCRVKVCTDAALFVPNNGI
jgi:hypothetical protein